MGFPRQGYWSGSPFLSPGEIPNPDIQPAPPDLPADSLPPEPPGKQSPNLGEPEAWCRGRADEAPGQPPNTGNARVQAAHGRTLSRAPPGMGSAVTSGREHVPGRGPCLFTPQGRGPPPAHAPEEGSPSCSRPWGGVPHLFTPPGEGSPVCSRPRGGVPRLFTPQGRGLPSVHAPWEGCPTCSHPRGGVPRLLTPPGRGPHLCTLPGRGLLSAQKDTGRGSQVPEPGWV